MRQVGKGSVGEYDPSSVPFFSFLTAGCLTINEAVLRRRRRFFVDEISTMSLNQYLTGKRPRFDHGLATGQGAVGDFHRRDRLAAVAAF